MSPLDSPSAPPAGCRLRLPRVLCRLSRMLVPKSLYRIDDAFRVPRRSARRSGIAVCVFFGLVAFPFLLEALSLWVAQWFQVMGKSLIVQTPLLDLSRDALALCSEQLSTLARCRVDEAYLHPYSVLPILAAILLIAARMLKK